MIFHTWLPPFWLLFLILVHFEDYIVIEFYLTADRLLLEQERERREKELRESRACCFCRQQSEEKKILSGGRSWGSSGRIGRWWLLYITIWSVCWVWLLRLMQIWKIMPLSNKLPVQYWGKLILKHGQQLDKIGNVNHCI